MCRQKILKQVSSSITNLTLFFKCQTYHVKQADRDLQNPKQPLFLPFLNAVSGNQDLLDLQKEMHNVLKPIR